MKKRNAIIGVFVIFAPIFQFTETFAGDPLDAARKFREACDGGNARACGELGTLHFTGKGVARSKSEAARLLRKACDGGYVKACSDLGIQYEYGLGVAQSKPEAARLHRKACEHGYVNACNYLGDMLSAGDGVAVNKTAAARSYGLACQGGSGYPAREACYHLGVMLETGDGIMRNKVEAARLQRKTCDPQSMKAIIPMESCTALQRLYVDAAAAEPGALTTPSGLVYRELVAGTGKSPSVNNVIKAHYHGTLLVDGTVFDSSVQRHAPLEASLSQMIRCWQEGVPMMKVGGKSKLTCPASIAYGSRGGGAVPAGAALTFEVELLEVLR